MEWIGFSFLYGIALAMDCLALSIADGLVYSHERKRKFFIVAASFGIFQGLFPLIGHLLGMAFSQWIDRYDHWIGFALLILIGGKMIYEGIKGAIHPDTEIEHEPKKLTLKTTIVQSIADSIDAFAIGITIEAFIHLDTATAVGYEVYVAFAIITLVTFIISLFGLFAGKLINRFLKGRYEITNIIGGVILVSLAVFLLLEGINVV